jgi:hypothetical protein
MRWLFVLPMAFLIAACSSTPPLKPESGNVKVSREAPGKNCKDLGTVNGRVKNRNGDFGEAIADMQLDAARLGANYVQMGLTGGMSQSVNGRAFLCE